MKSISLLFLFAFISCYTTHRCNEETKNSYDLCVANAYQLFKAAEKSSKNPNEPYTAWTLTMFQCESDKKESLKSCKEVDKLYANSL
jgi:hypothetical protein